MVVFQEKEPYFFHTMKAMNVMRKDMALCDIVLTFGQQTIHAHRCVLAAASPYFNSLFLGNFNEASMGNIDLSSVTQDMEAVEMILDFIYTGEINITEDNVGAVIKLASFFLVEQLSEFCLEFMNESFNLKNCLRYFFCSQDYGSHNLGQKTLSMIEARFHDFIIHEETSLDISPVELHFLLTNKVLQFCHGSGLLEFVLKWLLKGPTPTEKHIAVALDLMDYASRKKTVLSWNQRENDLEALYEKVAARPEVLGTDIGKKFLKNFRKIMSEMSRCCSPAVKVYNLRPHSPQLSSKQECHTERALVAFAPRPCVVKAVEYRVAKGRFLQEGVLYTESVFDLCVYLVSNQTWYHVKQLANEGVPRDLGYVSNGLGICASMRDEVIFSLQDTDEVCILNLRHMAWRKVSYGQLNADLGYQEDMATYEVISVVGANQAVYLILRINIWDGQEFENVCKVYICCYRLRDNDEWEFVFKTPEVDITDYNDTEGDTLARVSAESNEMLILHSSENHNFVYLADMSDQKPEPVPLLTTYANNERLFRNVHLLEGKTQMYIVKETPQKAFVTYEYRLKSKKLVPVAAPPAYLPARESALCVEARSCYLGSYPCLDRYSVSDGTSLWRVEGSGQETSHLTELRVVRNKNLVQVQHTPPPFPFITTVFPGRLDEDIISRMEPMVRYLSP